MKTRNTPVRRQNSGFTLIEMLLVVAIIAILVAVSIPMVGNSLERAREATDMANERAAKAAAVITYLSSDTDDPVYMNLADGTPVYYDITSGKLVENPPANGQGKGTVTVAYADYANSGEDTREKVIQVTMDKDTTELKIEWADKGGSSTG